jgi:protoporphyrinogen/coproporphyrinogen III oxidase
MGNGIPRVVVLGGGISGLSAAFRLLELSRTSEYPLEVNLLERSAHLGGALSTIREDGFVAEAGADSFLTEKPWALDLARRLGLDGDVIGTREEFRKTCVVRAGRLVDIPEGFSLLAPARQLPMMRSPLLSPWGKLRLAIEPMVPRRREAADESVACFVRRRMGREVLERIAQPLAGGIYTADPEKLSLEATLPRFAEMERRYGSVIRGLKAAARANGARVSGTSGARWGLFASLRDGMRTLVDALALKLGDAIRRGAEVTALERADAEGRNGKLQPRWRVILGDGARVDADAIICALPADPAARLLEAHSKKLSTALGAIAYESAAVVNLAYRDGDFPRSPRIFGFVVPAVERRGIIAASFTSLKFNGRAPAGTILVRAFLGGALQREMATVEDAAITRVAHDEFRALMDVQAAPLWTRVSRWPRSMPQYAVGHRLRVAEIEKAVAALPSIVLAGAALHGVGIPDSVHSGELAAEAVFAALERAR